MVMRARAPHRRALEVVDFLERLEALSEDAWLRAGRVDADLAARVPTWRRARHAACVNAWLARESVDTIVWYRFQGGRESAWTPAQRANVVRAAAYAREVSSALCEAEAAGDTNLHGSTAFLYAIFMS
jgi:hypothetical protein